MAIKDLSLSFTGGNVAYQPASPFEGRAQTVNFATYTIGASGADTVQLFPLNPGEVVKSAYLKILSPGNVSTTVTLTDSRNASAILAASASDAVANTYYKGAGAGVDAVPLNTAGFLNLTTAAAFALNTGSAYVYAVIQKAFN